MSKTTWGLGLLVGTGLIWGCSAKTEDPNTPMNMAGSAGMMAAAGTPSGGAGGAAAGSGGMATGGGGAAGDTGAAGVPQGGGMGYAPIDGACPMRSTLRMDGFCYCQPTTLSYCPDTCADFSKDPNHCGNCDTACEASQVCYMDACGATPTVAVPAAAGCGALTLTSAGGVLYWTDTMHGTVHSMAAGAAPAMVADTQTTPTGIEVSATSIFWIAGNSIMSAPIGGGAATPVVDAHATPINALTLSADGATVYFASETIVNSVPAAGGTVTEVGHEDSGVPKALAVADGLLALLADVNGDVDVMTLMDGTPAVCASDDSMTATNLNCARIGRSQGSLYFGNIDLIGGVAFWANQGSVVSSSAVAPTGFYDTIAQGSSDAFAIAGMVTNATTVYFTDNAGNVWKSPLVADSDAIPMARGQMGVTSMALDDTNVYWAAGDCSIMSLPAN